MTMNTELFKAILAMDSYNRGYGQGINFGINTDAVGITIGNATVLNNSSILKASDGVTRLDIPEGFYAIAYNYNGEAVISYRGTDENVVSPWGTNGSDLLNGYGVGAGYPMAPQAFLALQF